MHDQFMKRAIRIARQNPTAPFGALLVDVQTGQIVAEGVNRGSENPTWHGDLVTVDGHLVLQRRVALENVSEVLIRSSVAAILANVV